MRLPRCSSVIVMSAFLGGCAIKTPSQEIRAWPITQRALYYQEVAPYRVAVVPFLDQRPGHERTGQRPLGFFLLVWNRRVGDYYTGDRLFGQAINVQLAESLAAYLQAANVFAQVVTVPASESVSSQMEPQTAQVIARSQVADYVLGGELQHFFGSQHQHLSMVALPLYFINAFSWQDSKSLPWGQTTVRFALYDGTSGRLLWRHVLEASKTLPRETDSMATAALESFASVAGQLAVELRQIPFEAQGVSDTNEQQEGRS